VQSFPAEWDSFSVEIKPTEKAWQAFRTTLDALNVWCWRADYPNQGVCDGTNWSVEIVYTRAVKQLLQRATPDLVEPRSGSLMKLAGVGPSSLLHSD
jgi:hypothetical protein